MDAILEQIVSEKELEQTLKCLLKPVSAEMVAAFLKRKTGGFRNPEALKSLISLRTVGVENFCAAHIPVIGLIHLFSLEALEKNRRYFTSMWGKDVLILAMKMSPNKTVRENAELWATESGAPLPSKEIAEKQLNKILSAIGISSDASRQVSIQELRTENSKLRESLKNLKAAEERANRAKDAVAKFQKTADADKTEILNLRSELTAMRQANEKLQAELNRERDERNLCLQAEIELKMANEFHKWLIPLTKIEQISTGDLLTRAEKTIEKQKKIDKAASHFSSISDALNNVDSILEHSCLQLPELKKIRSDLSAALDVATERKSEVFEVLRKRVIATQENEFGKMNALISALKDVQFLSKAEIAELKEEFHKRAAVWTYSVPMQDKDFEDEENELTRRWPQLVQALSGKSQIVILVDGHNMLFALPGRYAPQRGKPLSDQGRRDRLVKDFVRTFFNLPMARVWIVFDGKTRTDSTASDNVRVTYSGGVGEHRADKVLVDLAGFFERLNLTESSKTPVFLVSNDNELCGNAAKHGAIAMPVHQLAAFLLPMQQSSGGGVNGN